MADGQGPPTLMLAVAIHITGIVQGVGFRPFVYRLAQQHELRGWVRNTSAGVDILAEGAPDALDAFVAALQAEAPPLAYIATFATQEATPNGSTDFVIHHSEAQPGRFQPISPDTSLCADCLRELYDPADRRCRYPFINCTNCGPRFTIIKDIPYDRPLTTMAEFAMCAACAAEYDDPHDRRFHAQPVACPACGPQVWLKVGEERFERDEAVRRTVELLHAGRIVAIRGLGGFHLACDATNEAAVAELRRRKQRGDKPFALMLRDLAAVEACCALTPAERDLLAGREKPVVLLERLPTAGIAPSVAPGQSTLGVMLPYTPLHVLLCESGLPLVMTSGNRGGEPIVTGNDEARTVLGPMADALLLHNRDIHIRTDDSVVRVVAGAEMPIRRSRGYAPYPVLLPGEGPPVLACGAELKNTFCLTRERFAFMSHHIGDMENYETLQSFEQGVAHFEGLFRVTPGVIAADLHPDYLATRYAHERSTREGIPAVGVQHHHAHIAACMAEHGHTDPVIGVAFDGTGYGTDGTIWGGEFLIADFNGFERAAHLRPVPLAGGDLATRRPARIALAYLLQAGLDPTFAALEADERRIVTQQIERGLNAPLTSSMGRLFDAVASLAGVRQAVTYEGQAAIELEALVDPAEDGVYTFGLDAVPLIRAVTRDVQAGTPPGVIAARFHRGVAHMVRDVCLSLRERTALTTVALSGGVFQNVTLLRMVRPLLERAGFTVLTHQRVPPNDGGLALGQAAIVRSQYR